MAKFIVIDGLDGCGKATQVEKVADRLKAEGYKVVIMSFPNYSSDSSAAVKMYLNGDLGNNPSLLNPYVCSSFYAIDRFINYIQNYKKYFEEDDNTIILADRYLSANIIYQGAKISESNARHLFIKWEYDYECGLCGMPVEDATILLTIPPIVSQKLLSKRYNGDESKKDIHESNIDYLNHCYNALSDTVNWINNNCIANWKWLDCYDKQSENIKTVDEITESILNEIGSIIGRQ